MGIFSEAMERYLNVKWVEMIAALFLWAVAVILYGYLEKKRLAKAKRKRAKQEKHTGAKRKKMMPEFMRCALYFSLFALILASCLWSYLSDLIPAAKDQNREAYEVYEGEFSYEEYLGGVVAFVGYTDRYGCEQRFEIPYFLREELSSGEGTGNIRYGRFVYGKLSRVVVFVDVGTG